MCYHLLVDGFGGMGDALVCVKCGLDRYPEAYPPGTVAALAYLGRVVREDNKDYAAWADLANSARIKRAVRVALQGTPAP